MKRTAVTLAIAGLTWASASIEVRAVDACPQVHFSWAWVAVTTLPISARRTSTPWGRRTSIKMDCSLPLDRPQGLPTSKRTRNPQSPFRRRAVISSTFMAVIGCGEPNLPTAYSYLGATSIVRTLLPQAGSFTPTGSNVAVPFTGNALVQSFQTNVTHQLALIPFIGKSFDRSMIYINAGPTLSQIRTTLNGLIGFADINGTRTDVSGSPVNFSSTNWAYGGAATVGASYFLSQSWFIDVNYTFAMTGNNTSSFSGPFTNPNGTNGSTTVGTMVGTSAGKLITQGIMATINKTF
jgi:hypothetical protein